MNFNANSNARQPGPSRKPKRVSDVNAIGTIPGSTNSFMPMTSTYQAESMPQSQQAVYGAPETAFAGGVNSSNYGFQPGYSAQQDMNQFGYQPPSGGIPPNQPPIGVFPSNQPHQGGMGMQPGQQMPQMPAQFAMFQQPMVQDMAMQYGQKLADQGKELVNEKFEKYVPVTRLKYYFSVDNKYVINKLRLLFFPFTHSDWSLKYDEDNPVQPRYDVNAPDLYIPAMAYITYVLISGFVLGMQNRFSPEQLGIQASSALAYTLIELFIYSVTLYVANIPTTLKTLDLLAYSGYKFTVIVACILISLIFQRMGYYLSLIYCGFSLAFFLLRALKSKVMEVVQSQTGVNGGYDNYGNQQYDQSIGRKRKLYFLFLVAGLQPVLCFWLSVHLIPSSTPVALPVTTL